MGSPKRGRAACSDCALGSCGAGHCADAAGSQKAAGVGNSETLCSFLLGILVANVNVKMREKKE